MEYEVLLPQQTWLALLSCDQTSNRVHQGTAGSWDIYLHQRASEEGKRDLGRSGTRLLPISPMPMILYLPANL